MYKMKIIFLSLSIRSQKKEEINMIQKKRLINISLIFLMFLKAVFFGPIIITPNPTTK